MARAVEGRRGSARVDERRAGGQSVAANSPMQLGAFSISLAVKDLAASRAFYEALGFTVMHGEEAQGWLIMKNGPARIGLFQGMFAGNILTFNPGWDADARPVDPFMDVREIQARLEGRGVTLTGRTDPEGGGVGHLTLVDPDGNAILIDQHRPKG